MAALSLLALATCNSRPIASTTRPTQEPHPKRCLPIARIYRSEIVDDRTILFHMRGGAIWQNDLPEPCSGLRMQGGFAYVTPLDRLCDLDLIQVLAGARSICGLGRFEPYAPPEGLEPNAINAATPTE